MPEINLLTSLHNQTKRDYLKRVNDKDYPKYVAVYNFQPNGIMKTLRRGGDRKI